MSSVFRPADPNERKSGSRRALAAVLLQQQPRLWPRFLSIYARLRRLPRGWRRHIARKAAVSLAGAALLLALGRAPAAHAANIEVVDGEVKIEHNYACSLLEAIINANDGARTHYDCIGGDVDENTITLPLNGNFTLTQYHAYYYGSKTGLPLITSKITIAGNGSTIIRDSGAPFFRLMALNATGNLTLNDTTLSGGIALGHGGALYGLDGQATLNRSAVLNSFGFNGGGIQFNNGFLGIYDSTISGNYGVANGGGVNLGGSNEVIIVNSTFAENESPEAAGGGLALGGAASMTSINSTFSGNTANNGAGLSVAGSSASATLYNTTITGNTTVDGSGGGISTWGGTLTLHRSLVSGNQLDNGEQDEIFEISSSTFYADDYNVFGYDGNAGLGTLDGYAFSPGPSDIVPAGALDTVLDTTLADNGGLTLTHALVLGSPALDKAPNDDCTAEPVSGFDQRGASRNEDSNGSPSEKECDIGAVEGFGPFQIFMAAEDPGITDDGVVFGTNDILQWDGSQWSLFFDGSAAGLTNKHDLNAIHVSNSDDVYLSFFQNKIKTADLGNVLGQDVLHYDGSGLSFYFDGSDVGLTTTAEKIDALHIVEDDSNLPGGGSCTAYLLISTLGSGKVPAAGGGQLKFQGEDILGFCATNTGADTAGGWYMVVDGSAEGMPKNSTDSISASRDGETIYLTTKGTFNVDSATGGHSMVYKFKGGDFSGPRFSAPANSLNQKVDGLHVEGSLP